MSTSAFFNAPLKVPSGSSLEVTGTTFLNGTTNVSSTLNMINGSNLVLFATGGLSTTLRTNASTSSYTLTLPTSVGSPGQVLTTDGTVGTLTWSTAGSSSIASNAIIVSNSGNITFATNNGAANISVDASNSIVFNVGTTNTTITASTITVNQSTQSANTTTGALVVAGGVGVGGNVNANIINSSGNMNVGDALTVSGNGVFNGRFVQAVDTITADPNAPGDAANIWTSGYKSIKHIRPQSNSSSYYVATGGSLVDGQMLHIFFTPLIGNTSRVDFGASKVYTGAGAAQYLTFTSAGQSATLIYLDASGGAGGWRVINTGAQVSS